MFRLKAPVQHGLVTQQLARQWPAYLAYLASFGYVGVIWVHHHQMFIRIAVVNTGLLWRNLALLLATSVLPFPTSVLGLAFPALILYAAVAAGVSATWFMVFHYLSRNPRLLEADTSPEFFRGERRRSMVGIVTLHGRVGCELGSAGGAIHFGCTARVLWRHT